MLPDTIRRIADRLFGMRSIKQGGTTGGRSNFSPITLGDNLRCLEFNGLAYTETSHKPLQKLARHYHENANIAFILDGSFTEILDKRRFECSPKSLIVKPAGEAHANQYGRSGMHCFLLEIKPQKLESLYPLSKVLKRVSHSRGMILSGLAMRIHKEMYIMDNASPIAMEGLSLELIAELSRHSNRSSERRQPHWLKRAIEFLHAHSAETISLADVATTVGVHPVHLARQFRRFYGCTLGEYVRRLRIEFACHQLSRSELRLADISLAAGFSDQAHFSRVFKRQTGITPSEFRSLYRIQR